MALEVLDFALVLFSGGSGIECSKIAALAGLRILFTRVEPVAAIFQFSNHGVIHCERRPNKQHSDDDVAAILFYCEYIAFAAATDAPV